MGLGDIVRKLVLAGVFLGNIASLAYAQNDTQPVQKFQSQSRLADHIDAEKKKKQEEKVPPITPIKSEKPLANLPFKLSVGYWITYSSGKAHATEHLASGETREGTRLVFEDDFDIDRGSAYLFALDIKLSDNDYITTRFLYEDSGWDSVLKRDIMFNETFYPAGTDMHAEWHHSRLQLGYRRKFNLNSSLDLLVEASVARDRISLKLEGNGSKKGENWGDGIIPSLKLELLYKADKVSIGVSAEHGFDLINMTPTSEETTYTTLTFSISLNPSDKFTAGLSWRAEHLRSRSEVIEDDGTHNRASNRWNTWQHGPSFYIEIKF